MKKFAFPVIVLMLALGLGGDATQAGVLDDLQKEIVALAAKAKPGVVAIEATGWRPLPKPGPRLNNRPGPKIRHRLVRPFHKPLRASGVILSKDGTIVTIGSQMTRAGRILVTLHDGTRYLARVVGADPATNLVVLKIDPEKDLQPMKVGKSKDLKAGSFILALGNPYGLGSSVSVGTVSGLNRHVGGRNSYKGLIQTTAAINPGDSGGMLINTKGELVGVLSATYGRAPSRRRFRELLKKRRRLGDQQALPLEPLIEAESAMGAEGINFAIPIQAVMKVVVDIQKGRIRPLRPRMGVFVDHVSPALRSHLGLEPGQGVLITHVQKNSRAARAGLKKWDVIVAFDGKKVHGARGLRKLVHKAKPDVKVKIELIRAGKRIELEADLGRAKRPPKHRKGRGHN